MMSLNRTGSAVACVQVLVEVDALVAVVVVVEPVAQGPLLVTEDASIKTRGRPDAMGTEMSPLESTVTGVQVYISISSVPDEYPLPLSVRVYELPEEP
jgi:hypothetical protein